MCPVALEDFDAQEFPFAAQVPVQGCAAGDYQVQLAPELLVDAAEKVSAERERSAAGRFEQRIPESFLTPTADLAFDAVHQEFQGLRDKEHGGLSCAPASCGRGPLVVC